MSKNYTIIYVEEINTEAESEKEQGQNPRPDPVLVQAIKEGDINKFHEELRNNPGSVYEKAPSNNTPLHIAAINGIQFVKPLVKILLANKANIDAKGIAGGTPLLGAAIYGIVPVAEYLLNNNANINAEDDNKNTPLGMAIHTGNKDMVEFLIKQGASINIESSDGLNALTLAAAIGNRDIFELVKKQHNTEQAELLKKLKQLKGETAKQNEQIKGLEQNLMDALNQLKGYLSTNLDVIYEPVNSNLSGDQHVGDELFN